jgi:hypothetical protein
MLNRQYRPGVRIANRMNAVSNPVSPSTVISGGFMLVFLIRRPSVPNTFRAFTVASVSGVSDTALGTGFTRGAMMPVALNGTASIVSLVEGGATTPPAAWSTASAGKAGSAAQRIASASSGSARARMGEDIARPVHLVLKPLGAVSIGHALIWLGGVKTQSYCNSNECSSMRKANCTLSVSAVRI